MEFERNIQRDRRGMAVLMVLSLLAVAAWQWLWPTPTAFWWTFAGLSLLVVGDYGFKRHCLNDLHRSQPDTRRSTWHNVQVGQYFLYIMTLTFLLDRVLGHKTIDYNFSVWATALVLPWAYWNYQVYRLDERGFWANHWLYSEFTPWTHITRVHAVGDVLRINTRTQGHALNLRPQKHRDDLLANAQSLAAQHAVTSAISPWRSLDDRFTTLQVALGKHQQHLRHLAWTIAVISVLAAIAGVMGGVLVSQLLAVLAFTVGLFAHKSWVQVKEAQLGVAVLSKGQAIFFTNHQQGDVRILMPILVLMGMTTFWVYSLSVWLQYAILFSVMALIGAAYAWTGGRWLRVDDEGLALGRFGRVQQALHWGQVTTLDLSLASSQQGYTTLFVGYRDTAGVIQQFNLSVQPHQWQDQATLLHELNRQIQGHVMKNQRLGPVIK
jgi:hypothetical protein